MDQWLTAVRPARAALDIGELVVEPTVRFLLAAGGFDRHTFFCGQSGSGKTFALGAAARFAAEGRKFGLYLLVSTQRPQRVNELVMSQCDNLVLMRMASAADLAYVSTRLSDAPSPLLQRATAFGLGEALVAGKIASHPAFVRFGPRIAQEGGGDVPTTWAEGGAS